MDLKDSQERYFFMCGIGIFCIVLSGFINLFDMEGKKNGATGNKSAGYNKSKGI